MTQAFCHLVLHYSIASLSWKTIKSLRRSRNRHRRKKKCDGDDDVPLDQNNDDGVNDVVTSVDYEILKGWTIIAFHSLYVSMGIECFVRFVVPFYFHLKMIVLIATFVIPSNWSSTSDGMSGLSPVVSYWFDYLIVPGVHRVHAFMGHDPKEWAKQQLAMLPLLLLWFILPGVFATDDEMELVRKKRSAYDYASENNVMLISKPSTEHPFDEQMISNDASSPTIIMKDDDGSVAEVAVKVPPQKAFTYSASSSNLSPKPSYDNLMTSHDQSLLREINDYYQSSAEDAGTASYAHASKFDSVEKAPSRKKEVEKKRFTTQKYPDDSKNFRVTPPRVLRDSTLFNEISPKRTPKSSLFPRTTPPLSTEQLYNSLSPTPSKKSSFHSIVSPAAKSRLESSAMRLRRISQEHRPRSVLSPHKVSSKGYASIDDEDTVSTSKPDKRTKGMRESEIKGAPSTRRKGQRLSLGDHFRELVTGDANIRVRDHLFDLDLPISPRRHLAEERLKRSKNNSRNSTLRDIDSSHVTTRRSSRLAKKNGQ